MERWINAHITVALPEDEYARIKKHPEIKWGAVGRKLIIQYLNEYEKSQELLEQSKKETEDEKSQGHPNRKL
jgi:hypothetical protein